MASLNKSIFLKVSASYLPLIILFISVFNEFDFNYLKIENFSFNFVYILVFYWTLRNPDSLGYFSIFVAGRKLRMNAVEIELTVPEQNQSARRIGQNLPAQLGANRATRAGHHDNLTTNTALEQRLLRGHRIPPQ